MVKQRTIARPVRASGIGLHSGKKVYMTLKPHVADGGIVFRRTDLDPPLDIPAQAQLIQETVLSSSLVYAGERMGTVEHLMSALAGLGIDNLLVEVDAPEIPIMDGSARPFIYLLQQAGLQDQSRPKPFVQITRPIEVRQDDKIARFEPYDGFRLNFTIDFDHPAFASEHQQATVEFSSEAYIEQVSLARTFGFLRDVEYLHANNLALGGGVHNAIVMDENRVLNEEGLRLADEFVRHKLLDAIGDLYLLGKAIIGQFTGYKSGHALNNQLLRTLLEQPDCYEVVTFDDIAGCPIRYIRAESDQGQLAVSL